MKDDSRISIARIYYPVRTLGPGQRIGIWTAGCPRSCEGCISPELQPEENGRLMTAEEIMELIRSVPHKADGITLSGGEPFYAPAGLAELMTALSAAFDDIIIFTGYTLEELRAMNSPAVDAALSLCSVLVDGPYVKALNDGRGMRGSSNQRIHIFRNEDRYCGLFNAERQLQNVLYDGRLLTVGIP